MYIVFRFRLLWPVGRLIWYYGADTVSPVQVTTYPQAYCQEARQAGYIA